MKDKLRDTYNECKNIAKKEVNMISFDANIILPYLIDMSGSFYFNERRTSWLLGITLEDHNFQYNYLFDEFDTKNFKKGADIIFSTILWTLKQITVMFAPSLKRNKWVSF